MNKTAYELANHMNMGAEIDACSTAIFSKNVHAAIEHIRWSLSSALGLSGFLDDAHTILGGDISYEITGIDMSRENTYQIKFRNPGANTGIKGKWDFRFPADASDLLTDTVRVPIQRTFTAGDGFTITLEELSLNELEQRVSYSLEGDQGYILQLTAEDDKGNLAESDTKIFYHKTGKGYMQNQEILYNGRIDGNAETVTLTLYIQKLPEESGKMCNDHLQVGEPFELRLQ